MTLTDQEVLRSSAEFGDILNAVLDELVHATAKHGPFPTIFHALAVIEEEVDELKEEVRHGTLDRAREEAIQVAAMGLRFLIDCEA